MPENSFDLPAQPQSFGSAPIESKSLESQPSSPKRPYLLYFLVSVFLILIGLALGWFIKEQTFQIAPAGEDVTPIVTQSIKPVVVGAIMPLTGDSSAQEIPMQQTAISVQREINRNGGIGGRPIEILWEDGRCEFDDAKIGAERLINEKRVDFLMGGNCSSEFLASAPIAQAKKVISFSPSATSPEISELGKYVFRLSPSDNLAGKAAAEYAIKKMKAKTVAVITQNKDYPLGLRQVFTIEFERLGGMIVYDEVFNTGTTDFTVYANKVAEFNPDVVYIVPQSAPAGVLLVTALKNRNIASKILTGEILLERATVETHGKILEGITGIEIYFDEENPKSKAFTELYRKDYGAEPPSPAFMAGVRDILYLIKESIERVGDDPDKIAQYLYSLEYWDGATGKITFDENGDPTLPYSIRTVISGEAVQVDRYTPGM